MDYLKKYIETIPYFNNEKKKTSRFGITEDMVPSFSNGKRVSVLHYIYQNNPTYYV